MKFLTALSLLAALPPLPLSQTLTGEASWYGRELAGKKMANGKPFDPSALTCATWFYPMGTELRVTNVATGRSVYVKVTDRGPAWRLVWKRNRIIDLSRAAFAKIGLLSDGHLQVKIETVEKVSSVLTEPMSDFS